MASTTTRRGFRSAAAAVLLLGGIGVAAATWVGGDHAWALAAIAAYLALAILAYFWARRSGDVAALLRGGGDERQRGLDRDATAVTGLVMVVAAIVGALISLGRTGDPGVFGGFCVLAGVSYAVALFALHRRR